MQNKVEMLIVRLAGDRWIGMGAIEVLPQRVARMSKLLTVKNAAPRFHCQSAKLVGYREADTGRVLVSQEQYNQNFS